MTLSRSDRTVLGVLIALGILGVAVGYITSHSPYMTYTAQEMEEPLDLNKASFTELLRLPGIGPTLAERIIFYRERHGPFRSLEELLNVRGIGPTLLAKLKERLTVP